MIAGTPTLALLAIAFAIAHLPFFLLRIYLKRDCDPSLATFSMVTLAAVFVLASLGFVVGVFGPLFLSDSPHGPLLAFITTPVGALLGVLTTWAWFWRRCRLAGQ